MDVHRRVSPPPYSTTTAVVVGGLAKLERLIEIEATQRIRRGLGGYVQDPAFHHSEWPEKWVRAYRRQTLFRFRNAFFSFILLALILRLVSAHPSGPSSPRKISPQDVRSGKLKGGAEHDLATSC